jgi:hypothetical protein
VAFYDVWELAEAGDCQQIIPLIKSIIEVTQTEPAGLARLPELVAQLQAGQALPSPAAGATS